jgi:hypothetical protein
MSLSHSPQVVTNGLVFYYDMGNPQKSWKGELTTNLLPQMQPNASNWVTAGIANNDGLWHHVVGTYDRSISTARIYVDGILRNTNSSIITGPTSNTQSLLVGSRFGTAGFSGSISVVKIYNRSLTAQEVQQNFNTLKGRYGI